MEDTHLTPQKIKSIVSDPVVRTILISLVTVFLVLGGIAFAAWHYRDPLFKALGIEYAGSKKDEPESLLKFPVPAPEVAPQKPVVQTVLPPQAPVDTVVGAVKKAKPAVVSIIVSKNVPTNSIFTPNQTEKKQLGSGSGFLISSDGLVVTNKHVVIDKESIYEVLLNNGKKYTATVLARDGVLDIALLKINANNLPYLNLADSSTLEVGQSVIAIGNALGEFKNSVSLGVVSGLSRSVIAGGGGGQSERLDKVIQTDAAINPGNSGGPLLNLHGDVVGINVAVVQGSANVGFALPINSVKSAINSVVKTGKIVRPFIGIRYVTITSEIKAKYNLSVDYGLLVQKGASDAEPAVMSGSPASKAGILENDIILAINGSKLDQEIDFASLLRSKKVGDVINVKVLSKGVEKTISIRLEAAPEGM